jgi:hypothetical protein
MIEIGNWVRRKGGKWHLVDSKVVDRVVTRCGREMKRELHGVELAVSTVMPLTRMIDQPQLCKGGCDKG